MKIWRRTLERGERITFEVLGKEAAWTQFARIKAVPGSEKSLGDAIGAKQYQGPFTGNTVVTFKPYSRDGHSNVRESDIKVVPQGNRSWLLRMEDGGGADYNDYVVRASITVEKDELKQIEDSFAKAKKAEQAESDAG